MPSRPVAPNAAELLAGATDRVPLRFADGKSNVPMERVWVDGAPYLAKSVSYELDWIVRATGDVQPRVVRMWSSGLLDALPPSIDHTIVGVAYDEATRCATLLMRDVGEHFLPEADEPFPFDTHRSFLAHMAEMHAAFWGWRDSLQLLPEWSRYSILSPSTSETERARGSLDGVPALLPDAWDALVERTGDAGRRAIALSRDATPLVLAMRRLPKTLVHSDWKAGNLGRHPDGRTILVDWAVPGAASPTVDVAWYLAVNSTRLPETKESAIAAYRAELAARGVDVQGWWDRALALALAGAFILLGWSKTDDPDELGWWADRAGATFRTLG